VGDASTELDTAHMHDRVRVDRSRMFAAATEAVQSAVINGLIDWPVRRLHAEWDSRSDDRQLGTPACNAPARITNHDRVDRPIIAESCGWSTIGGAGSPRDSDAIFLPLVRQRCVTGSDDRKFCRRSCL